MSNYVNWFFKQHKIQKFKKKIKGIHLNGKWTNGQMVLTKYVQRLYTKFVSQMLTNLKHVKQMKQNEKR